MNIKSRVVQSVIESPCVRNCCLNNNDVCLGCFRSLTEIKQWTLVDHTVKLAILNNAIKRKKHNTAEVFDLEEHLEL